MKKAPSKKHGKRARDCRRKDRAPQPASPTPYDPKAITDKLNQVYSKTSSALAPMFERAQFEVLEDT
jgi:hypothetical protein